MVTMFSSPHHPLFQHGATLRQPRISRDPHFAVAQVLDKNEPQSEAEQFIENKYLGEAKKAEPEQLIENKGSRVGQIFY
jgi:hypothetical protein